MRRRILISIAFTFITGVASATTISVQPTGQVTTPGNIVSVAVDVSSITDLFAFQFDLHYDPTVLSVTDPAEGAFLTSQGSTAFFPGIIDNIGGTISFVADSLVGPVLGVSGSGTLANIQFHAVNSGNTAILLDNVLLLDSKFSTISATSNNGSVTVQGTAVTPEPSALVLSALGFISLAMLSWKQASASIVQRDT